MARKIITLRDALGPQNRGSVLDPRLRSLTQTQLREIFEWRRDVLGPIDPRIGLQFTPDSELPWQNPLKMKVNLGTYRAFSVEGWLNIADPADPNRHKAEFCMPVHLVKVTGIDFIYAPFILHKVPDPLAALRNWKDCLRRVTGILCLLIEDQDLRMRKGLEFNYTTPIYNEARLRQVMTEAGFVDLCKVNISRFDLCGDEDYYVGFFGYVS